MVGEGGGLLLWSLFENWDMKEKTGIHGIRSASKRDRVDCCIPRFLPILSDY